MKAEILAEKALPLPSASGIEIIGHTAYVISDDAPFLYRFNAADLQPLSQLALFETGDFAAGRIPKKLKPDLEALTHLTVPGTGEQALLALGSGSDVNRQRGFWIPLPQGEVQALDLAPLYGALRPLLPADLKFNLEAAAATSDELLLLQRTAGTAAGSILIRLPLAPAIALLRGQSTTLPAAKVTRYTLPLLQGRPAGFSGAAFFEDRLWITASVEDTDDPILDGPTLGSFVGVLDLADSVANPRLVHLTGPGGARYAGKVEGLAVRGRPAPDTYDLLLVTDDDAGGSTVLSVEVKL